VEAIAVNVVLLAAEVDVGAGSGVEGADAVGVDVVGVIDALEVKARSSLSTDF
jgi:hypothetical protein